MGQDQRPVGIDQTHLCPDDKQGDQRDHGRQQHRSHAEHEQKLLAPEAQTGKGIAAHGSRDDRADDGGHQDGHGVAEELPVIKDLQRLRVVGETPFRRCKGRRISVQLAVGHERRAEDPIDGEHDDQPQQDQHGDGQDVGGLFALLLGGQTTGGFLHRCSRHSLSSPS